MIAKEEYIKKIKEHTIFNFINEDKLNKLTLEELKELLEIMHLKIARYSISIV